MQFSFEVLRSSSRRETLFALAAATGALLTANQSLAGSGNVTKLTAWVIGDDLSLAAMLYAQGAAPEILAAKLNEARDLAGTLNLTIKPFPPKADDKPGFNARTYADVIHYLIAGDGWALAKGVADAKDFAHGVLFEIAVKSNLLIMLYQPDDDKGMSGFIRSRCQEINLPERLWGPLVTAMKQHGSEDQIKDAVFKMHDAVKQYLLTEAD